MTKDVLVAKVRSILAEVPEISEDIKFFMADNYGNLQRYQNVVSYVALGAGCIRMGVYVGDVNGPLMKVIEEHKTSLCTGSFMGVKVLPYKETKLDLIYKLDSGWLLRFGKGKSGTTGGGRKAYDVMLPIDAERKDELSTVDANTIKDAYTAFIGGLLCRNNALLGNRCECKSGHILEGIACDANVVASAASSREVQDFMCKLYEEKMPMKMKDGTSLALRRQRMKKGRKSPPYLQYGCRFGNCIHYEIIDRKTSLAVVLHDERRVDAKDSLRKRLYDIVRSSQGCDGKIKKTSFEARVSNAIHCSGKSFEQIKGEVESAVNKLYAIFDTVLKERESEFIEVTEGDVGCSLVNVLAALPEREVDDFQDPPKKLSEIQAMGVGELMALPLRIPLYQRPYEWLERNVTDMLDDLCKASRDHNLRYRIGSLILHKVQKDDEVLCYDIVDGQQRTLTLILLGCVLRALAENCGETAKASSFDPYVDKMNDGNFYPTLNDGGNNSCLNLQNNFKAIAHYVSVHNARVELAEMLRNRLEVVVICVNEPDEAFQLFDSQNSRGRHLDPPDLLKAYHLREIVGDKSDVVKRWDMRDAHDIANLFGKVLYPIYRWGRCEQSKPFTALEMNLFKGVPPDMVQDGNGPRYTYVERAIAGRQHFLIGEPIVPGRSFFDMVDHYFELTVWIENLISENDDIRAVEQASSGEHLKRLYRNVLLCYFDRFGKRVEEESKLTIRKLCLWTYIVQLDLDKVSSKTPNRYAIGADNPKYSNKIPMFARIQHALRPSEISGITICRDAIRETLTDSSSSQGKRLLAEALGKLHC